VTKKVGHGAAAPGRRSWSGGGELAEVDGLSSSSSSPVYQSMKKQSGVTKETGDGANWQENAVLLWRIRRGN
jgi:hypothetical protein